MIDIKSRLESATNRGKWAARGASFVTKAKATKAVWFPPEPVETSKKAGKKAGKTGKKATKKATGAAKKKTADGAKNVPGLSRRKKA